VEGDHLRGQRRGEDRGAVELAGDGDGLLDRRPRLLDAGGEQ